MVKNTNGTKSDITISMIKRNNFDKRYSLYQFLIVYRKGYIEGYRKGYRKGHLDWDTFNK